MKRYVVELTTCWVLIAGCGGERSTAVVADGGEPGGQIDAGASDAGTEAPDAGELAVVDAGSSWDAGSVPDAGEPICGFSGGACYATACPITPRTLQDNRDRLIADLARRKCADSCGLWASLSLAERYIFLMDTAYLGDPSSRLYPPEVSNQETALDHALALYSINAPKAGQGVDLSGRGGKEYNRIYLGFDALAQCVMRDAAQANSGKVAGYNQWVKSDDAAGPHPPFTQRDMIMWYRATLDLSSNGPQFHYWAKDSDFTQTGVDQRSGVCGVTDRSLTELTIAFDYFHNSDPLGDYAGRGGKGWEIVDQHVTVDAHWAYTPTGCSVTAPVNTDPFGGGTYAGLGPTLQNGTCAATKLGTNCQ